MLIASTTIASIASTPLLIASAVISKIFSLITGIKPMDVSRETFIGEMKKYISLTSGLTSEWVCGGKVHVLCRYATIFSNYPPIVFIHESGSSSFHYAEFMKSFPNIYDVYCIDLPGWGVSECPPFHLETAELLRCYDYYGNIIMSALAEIHPSKDAKFVFVGHSFGALLLMKAIALDYIPQRKIKRCILTCMPGLDCQTAKYHFNGSLFISGWMESIFKQWWARHLFSALLYRKKTQLQTLQHMCSFIPNGIGYKLLGKHMSLYGFFNVNWITPVNSELLHIAKYKCTVKLIGASIHEMNIPNIKCYELNGGHSLFAQQDLFPNLLQIINNK